MIIQIYDNSNYYEIFKTNVSEYNLKVKTVSESQIVKHYDVKKKLKTKFIKNGFKIYKNQI